MEQKALEASKTKQIVFIAIIVVIVIAGIAFWLFSGESYTETASYSEDTVIMADYTIPAGEKTVLRNGARFTVMGDLAVHGALECEGGPLRVSVEGATVVSDLIRCEAEDEAGLGVSIVAKGGLDLSEDSRVMSAGNIQLTDDERQLLSTAEDFERMFDETGRVAEDGVSVGPFVADDGEGSISKATVSDGILTYTGGFHGFIPRALAQAPAPVVIRGRMNVGVPPAGVKRLVIFAFPNAQAVQINDFELSGPAGRRGADDKGANCNAKGGDGEDAFRFNASAPNLAVNNFTLNLGDGGAGGDAETSNDCDNASAKGGNGGDSGNFRMTASNNFEIKGSFTVHPGRGGAGGNATAIGKNGGPEEDGGNARAEGGRGADNRKKLSVRGAVAGVPNVRIGDVVGGFGGTALAHGGQGGAGNGCRSGGGDGGDATANGGDGGDASLSLSGGAGRAPFAKNIGGQGGIAEATAGSAGSGGDCGPADAGGNGGDGGDATAREGRGGSGESGRASDGAVLDETGGNGGNGGDGCPEGKGGSAGQGDPDGTKGEDGSNLCSSTETESNTSLSNKVRVIQWMDYYIPVDSLRLVPAHEPFCAEDHWHADGPVLTLQGGVASDPDPANCGFCTISSCPVVEVSWE